MFHLGQPWQKFEKRATLGPEFSATEQLPMQNFSLLGSVLQEKIVLHDLHLWIYYKDSNTDKVLLVDKDKLSRNNLHATIYFFSMQMHGIFIRITMNKVAYVSLGDKYINTQYGKPTL